MLCEAGDSLAKVFFPHRGAISLVTVLKGGQMVQTAMVGREGMMGGFAALNDGSAVSRAIVQIEGIASTLEVEVLRHIANRREAVHTMLLRHERGLYAETQQVAACNASHALDARFCRWLLRASDACADNIVSTTQESIADMLGVRRTSISLVAHTMQQRGLIRTRRGHVELLNIGAIRDSACECYAATAAHYERMLVNTPVTMTREGERFVPTVGSCQ